MMHSSKHNYSTYLTLTTVSLIVIVFTVCKKRDFLFLSKYFLRFFDLNNFDGNKKILYCSFYLNAIY